MNNTLCQLDKSILEMKRELLIKELVAIHEKQYKPLYVNLKSYYNGNHTNILKKKSSKSKPNNKVTNPFPALIVNTIQGYLLGQPAKYVSENEPAIELVQEVYDSNDETDASSEILKSMSICGEAFEYVYINEDKQIEFAELPQEETLIVYDNSLKPKVLLALRYYDVVQIGQTKPIRYAEIYTKDSIEYYKSISAANYTLEEEYTHAFGQVPVVHYKNNEELSGDFEKILSLIDDFDKVLSSDSDEIEYFRNAYLILSGFGKLTDKDLEKFKETGAFVIPNGNANGTSEPVKFVTKDLNTESVHKHLQVVVDNIHKFSQVPNFVDPKAGTSDSGVAIKQKTWGFEQLIGSKERKLEKGLFQRLRLILIALYQLGKESYDANEFSIKFSRNLPSNTKEDAEVLSLLGVNIAMLSEEGRRDVLSKVTLIEDAQHEASEMNIEPIEKENKKEEDNLETNI